ncbi:aspartate/glutamate racemase family protein [Pelagibius sp.]|uniref:aspartate/glutamate racemase family protein n=1 Tax=Pelagibius sp. TaxID=1931238 RepID=UPI00260B11C4|nr:aspartate/glutamate racemase family protein [Pelagibius sp.]
MHIGLIGGIGPAATDYYYRWLIRTFAGRPQALELTIAHADSPTLLSHLAEGKAAEQAAIFERLTRRLQGAGAEAVAVTSIAGHFCIDAFKAVSPLPVIDLLSSVARRLDAAGYRRVGILGTKGAMVSALYGRLKGIEVMAPAGAALDQVHQAYVDMAVSGAVSAAQRRVFFDSGRRLTEDAGVEAVLLGGTDLFLAFDGQEPGFKAIDCALLHMADIADEAAR